jgi:hypothetical protein
MTVSLWNKCSFLILQHLKFLKTIICINSLICIALDPSVNKAKLIHSHINHHHGKSLIRPKRRSVEGAFPHPPLVCRKASLRLREEQENRKILQHEHCSNYRQWWSTPEEKGRSAERDPQWVAESKVCESLKVKNWPNFPSTLDPTHLLYTKIIILLYCKWNSEKIHQKNRQYKRSRSGTDVKIELK